MTPGSPRSVTGRADLDHLVQARHLPGEEPRFLLRARDPAAHQAVLAWVDAAHRLGVPTAVLEQALQQADAMAAWPTKQRPGDEHLAEHERKQLEYQHGRRAWRAGLEMMRGGVPPGLDLVLSYRRGWDARAAEERAARVAEREGEPA